MKINITESKLKQIICETVKDYLNYDFLCDSWGMNTETILSESLTCSYNIGKLIKILKHKINLEECGIDLIPSDFNYNSKTPLTHTYKGEYYVGKNKINISKTEETDNWIRLDVYFKKGIRNNKDILDKIIKLCDVYGWFLAGFRYFERDENLENQQRFVKNIDYNDKWLMKQPIDVYFRAKFNQEYKDKSIPNFLYHIAPVRVLDKIKKQGLTPRNNGRQESHPERVYCYLEKPNNLDEITYNFRKSGNIEPYALLQIDRKKINPQIKFYYDSNIFSQYPKAIYTNEPIPPNAIKLIYQETEEDINNNKYNKYDI